MSPPLSSPTPNSLLIRELSPMPNDPDMSKIMDAFKEIASLKNELRQSSQENEALKQEIKELRQRGTKMDPSKTEKSTAEAEPEQMPRLESQKIFKVEPVPHREPLPSATLPENKQKFALNLEENDSKVVKEAFSPSIIKNEPISEPVNQ